MDHLDAAQIARLECLKLAIRMHMPTGDVLAEANRLARFVLNGELHDASDQRGQAA